MKIDFLYFEGCPSYKIAYKYLKEVLEEEKIDAEIEKIHVSNDELAKKLKFLGSPTIRINGKDIDKSAQELKDFGIKCRIYFSDGEIMGYPSKEVIRSALKAIKPKVTVVFAQWCPVCPLAKKLWNELKTQYDFEYEEADIATKRGRDLILKHSIRVVPTTIINDEVAFVGVPKRDEAIEAIK